MAARRRGFFYAGGDRAPELWILRLIGWAYLALFVVTTAKTRPHPSLDGKGLGVTLALLVLLAAIIVVNPRRHTDERRRAAGLVLVIASAAVLEAFQPNGIWPAAPYFVAIVAALRTDLKTAAGLFGLCLLAVGAVAGARGHWEDAWSGVVGAIPWFFVLRLMRRMREYGEALEASQEAEARAAADAERGRVAREMHDVLAHSLSALALQLESARLVARDRGADPELTDTLDRAHHQAVEGLEEARRAIGALRGEVLPGPERLEALADAFEEQTGVPTALHVVGEPRPLAADASLALYRTAQEALTNARRHAAPDRVELRLEYADDATVLVVEDRADRGMAVPVTGADSGGGYGLTGMRERAELLGGRLDAGPTEHGFRVELWLPW